ncbi:murein transglycosylase [Fusarium heterosporum]|uniref:lytic cellulose monooxygenase (C4-dehydrogenating) n=1 Tax=Fusarium heterosporum TaxID=42747 RepID=A0A8H5TSS5_FUSHE|nr:murein transglycosylase [Fusarium heterosporum]
MKFLTTVLGLASAANAHTLFTTLFIDGENQGDGTCVRQPNDASKANSPIYPIDGNAMACGENGNKAVKFICPAPGGAQLTFQFRESPSYHKPGAIAEGHKGPCSVYMKKVDDMFSDSAAGDGWFKVWEDGYNSKTNTWCVDTLRANDGLLSVDLPTGLPSGYYLVRPEVLALHNAPEGDPQFYTSCAQIFIENGPEGPLEIPEKYEVSIPGYVNKKDPGLTYNIYSHEGEYSIPGPEVWIPTSKDVSAKQTQKQKEGIVPKDCLAKNANWCGKPIAKYSGQDACWAAAKTCWDEVGDCWDNAPPSGGHGCDTWNDYCKEINRACKSKDFEGPPTFTGKEFLAEVPGPIPAPYGEFKGSDLANEGKNANLNHKPTSTEAHNSHAKTIQRTVTITQTANTAKKTKETEQVATRKWDKYEKNTKYKDTPVIAYPLPVQTADAASAPEHKETEPVATRKWDKYEKNTKYKDTPVIAYPMPVQTGNVPSVPAREESSGLKVSEDGFCGGETGQTCEGSKFGDCCSRGGKCGRKAKQCECGCQKTFGICKK